ncbi:MAG TPA: hypothetical protein VM869_19480, partial [Enhygromyxa sp.]|nr:hypothetical protein [Enhygromyxa sp.]
GQTWKKIIARDELDAYAAKHQVIASRLFAGRMLIHVLAESRPDASFDPVEPDLEDVYFTTLARARVSARQTATADGAAAGGLA